MLSLRRSLSTLSTSHEASLFINAVFPLQLATWDLRYYLGLFREETLLTSLRSKLESVESNGFTILDMKPYYKDGGVFVRFSYNAEDPGTALSQLEAELKTAVTTHGGLPSWNGLGGGHLWLVRGKPWLEDMHRYPSRLLKVSFEGPDISEERIYDAFRPYGHIRSVVTSSPVPAGSLRSITINYQNIHAAAIARNVLHGSNISNTTLHTIYQQPLQAHVVRNWASSHPKIVLPLLAFLLGTLTYTIFDPIRSMMVQAKLEDWFDVENFRLYRWLRTNTYDRLTSSESESGDVIAMDQTWKQWEDAASAVRGYLTDFPSSINFIHGPQGSGKSRMLDIVLRDTNREVLIIDCLQVQKSSSDAQLVSNLAKQCGYRPIFSFFDSFYNLIDLASVGLIGQKSGLRSSLVEQVQQILNVVGHALENVHSSNIASLREQAKEKERLKAQAQVHEERSRKIMRGIYHDGRLDCVAGNGVMSELGVGDEAMTELDADMDIQPVIAQADEKRPSTQPTHQRSNDELQAVEALPVIVLKNFASIGSGKDEILDTLSQWAANLVERQVAHVIVLSDNRENSKRLAKALSSKPLYSVALSDADVDIALSFVQNKLNDAGITLEYSSNQVQCVNKLGGRTSDLESFIHKIRAGMKVEEAFEDIINRGVGELRKTAFGDDVEDAKGLPWSREQAWILLKRLSKEPEIPYYDVLADFPFKGDESALRSMEHSDLIAISTLNGRPTAIKPGKPVFKYVFERLAEDPIFHATNEIAYNTKIIASAQSTIRDCEQELLNLKDISGTSDSRWPFGNQVSSQRAGYLAEKMQKAQKKIEEAEKKNEVLKKVLAKGG